VSIIEAVLLGLVQGLTEFIPVSSSGHLIAGHTLFGTTESTLTFDVALHVGTLLALVVFFWRDIVELTRNALAKSQKGKLARIIVAATIPAAVIGFFASDWIDDTLRKPEVVVVTMLVMGTLMLVAEKYAEKRADRHVSDIEMNDGLVIGFAQALALIPGVSRSGATITTGMFRSLKRAEAARFSFLMAIPITAGAIAGSLLGAESSELNGQMAAFAVGIISAAVSGLFAIKFLLAYLSKHSLKSFAYYRFVFATVLLVIILVK
jgi:undecaprenyl-diphosphatase